MRAIFPYFLMYEFILPSGKGATNQKKLWGIACFRYKYSFMTPRNATCINESTAYTEPQRGNEQMRTRYGAAAQE